MCKSISMHKNVNLNLFLMIQGRKKIMRTRPPSNTHLSVRPSISLSVRPSIRASVRLSVRLSGGGGLIKMWRPFIAQVFNGAREGPRTLKLPRALIMGIRPLVNIYMFLE